MKQKSIVISKIEKVLERISALSIIRIVQRGITLLIPILLIGSFSLILKSFPLPQYQTFLATPVGSILYDFFDAIYQVTFGMLSLYMSISIGFCMANESGRDYHYIFGTLFTSVLCFLISIGAFSANFKNAYFGVNGMFMAIFVPLVASWLYLHLYEHTSGRLRIYTSGANFAYNSALSAILPMCAVLLLFVIFHMVVSRCFDVACVQELFVRGIDGLFSGVKSMFRQGLLFVFLSSLLWFFGIHGSDVLNIINDGLFASYMAQNVAAAQAGLPATNIMSKTFIDVFVLMGGCGAAMCLLIAIFLFGRQINNRHLAKTAVFPMLFNINELMVFGLPIIFNPSMFIPFLLTPIILFLTSYGAIAAGFVPVPMQSVEWTTPILLSGYQATGSIAGSVLQLCNLAIGICIYAPFVRLMERQWQHRTGRVLEKLIEQMKKEESTGTPIELNRLPGETGAIVKMLTLDLQHALQEKELVLYYQPQFDNNMRYIGTEALLRWNHSSLGMMYPPLVIQLAEEAGFLTELEKYILTLALEDHKLISETAMPGCKLSVNISAKTVCAEGFADFLLSISQKNSFSRGAICLEITEQSALTLRADTIERLFLQIREMGYLLAIDDFSMGHTSLKYLQDNHFDVVKLDGSLVREMSSNQRCRDIIRSIIYLSKSLGFTVLAEFVETPEQMASLDEIGCHYYQGWLFSAALPKKALLEFIRQRKS